MADDQKPKTMDINDLVRELSKSSTTPTTPTLQPAPRPSFPTPKPPLPPMAGSTIPSVPKPSVQTLPPVSAPQMKPLETPKPQFSAPPAPLSQPKPAPTSSPAVPVPTPTPGVKEYQSSIRTMGEDISKIKQGQQPMGVPVPRKVEQVTPILPITPPPATKPAVPGSQFRVPSVNLGEAQKTGPLASSKDGIKAPPAPKAGPTPPAPQIFVPQEGQKGSNRNMLFIGIGVVAVAAGFAYWFFVLRSPAPEVVVQTPAPTQTTTATPVPTPTPTLISIFSGAQKQSVGIKPKNSLAFFVSDVVGKAVIDPGKFKVVNATDVQTASVAYSFSDLLTKFSLKIPSELASNFGSDSAMLIYGQKESFDSKGNLQVGVTAPNRIVMVAELKALSGASQAAAKWETTLSSDLKILFGLGTANKNQPGFIDNSYKNTSIRYRNFPYSDKTIDYAIVSALNGKNYLVITDSRESIFAVIDKLVSP